MYEYAGNVLSKHSERSNSDIGMSNDVKEALVEEDSIFSHESYIYSNQHGLILELKEDILHPLIDSSNSRLFSVCQEIEKEFNDKKRYENRRRLVDMKRKYHSIDSGSSSQAHFASLRGNQVNMSYDGDVYDSITIEKQYESDKRLRKPRYDENEKIRVLVDQDRDNDSDTVTLHDKLIQTLDSDTDLEKVLIDNKIKSCKMIRKSKYFNPSKNTIAVHMWTHVYLGWNFIRSFYNWRIYSTVESTLSSRLIC